MQTEFWVFTVGISRPDRSRCKAPTTSRTDIVKHRFHTIGTIGAFITANAGIHRVWGKIPVTPLAVRFQF